MKKRSKESKSKTNEPVEEEERVELEETEEDTVDKKRSRYILFIGIFNQQLIVHKREKGGLSRKGCGMMHKYNWCIIIICVYDRKFTIFSII